MSQDSYHAQIYHGSEGAPLVFAFHGTGGDETQFFDLARQILPQASIVAPRGDVSEMGAARFFRRTGEGIYDMDDLAQRSAAMASFIASHKANHPGAPVYAFGYSNGANILASVMMLRPDLIDRVALLHPLVPWQLPPLPLPALSGRGLLITAGQNDPICPANLSAQLIDWARMQDMNVTTEIHPGGHEIRQPEIQALAQFLTKSPSA